MAATGFVLEVHGHIDDPVATALLDALHREFAGVDPRAAFEACSAEQAGQEFDAELSRLWQAATERACATALPGWPNTYKIAIGLA